MIDETGLERLIGIPYVAGGKDFTGVDCIGIIDLYFREQKKKNIEVPNYEWNGGFGIETIKWCTKELKRWAANKKIIWRQEELIEDDIICFALHNNKYIDHFGVYLDTGRFLHILNGEAKSGISKLGRDWDKRFKFAVRTR